MIAFVGRGGARRLPALHVARGERDAIGVAERARGEDRRGVARGEGDRDTPSGDPHGDGLRFLLQDIQGERKQQVTVVYKGSVPDLFRTGRDVVVTGTQRADGVFVTTPGSMITKCPSKYQAADTA